MSKSILRLCLSQAVEKIIVQTLINSLQLPATNVTVPNDPALTAKIKMVLSAFKTGLQMSLTSPQKVSALSQWLDNVTNCGDPGIATSTFDKATGKWLVRCEGTDGLKERLQRVSDIASKETDLLVFGR